MLWFYVFGLLAVIFFWNESFLLAGVSFALALVAGVFYLFGSGIREIAGWEAKAIGESKPKNPDLGVFINFKPKGAKKPFGVLGQGAENFIEGMKKLLGS